LLELDKTFIEKSEYRPYSLRIATFVPGKKIVKRFLQLRMQNSILWTAFILKRATLIGTAMQDRAGTNIFGRRGHDLFGWPIILEAERGLQEETP
jgi:hypothetical protein